MNDFDRLFGTGPTEPGSDARQNAANLFEHYAAYIQAGFTPAQSMQLLTTTLRAVIAAQAGGSNRDDN